TRVGQADALADGDVGGGRTCRQRPGLAVVMQFDGSGQRNEHDLRGAVVVFGHGGTRGQFHVEDGNLVGGFRSGEQGRDRAAWHGCAAAGGRGDLGDVHDVPSSVYG